MPLTLEVAQKIIEAAMAKARSMDLRVTTCVVDTEADLVAMARMDGVPAWTGENVRGKTMVAAIYKQLSGEIADKATVPEMGKMNYKYGGKLLYRQGGVPLIINGEFVGAVGSGGGGRGQDEEIAMAAAAAVANLTAAS